MTKTVDKLKALFSEAVPSTMLHAGILSAYKSGVDRIEKTVGVEKAQSNIKADPEKTQSVPTVFFTSGSNLIANPHLTEEVFGPVTVVTSCDSKEELRKIAESLHGHLTATVHGTEEDLQEYRWLLSILETKVGRLVVNGFPTGVEICPSLVHGGPFPATSDSRTTSVGSDAIKRFVRPVCYQNFPQSALPVELKDENTAGIWRLVNGEKKK